MQALILAAGMGKRLKQLTKHATKCMVEVNGVSMIERMLRQLDKKKLSQIVLVVGYEGEKLKEYVSSLHIQTPITYVSNNIYDRTNNIYSLYLAKDYLEQEDTILLESDLIFEDTVLDRLLNNTYPSLVLVDKFQSWMDGTCVTLDDEKKITGMYDKKHFKFEQTDDYYKTVNIYKFSRDFSKNQYIPFLEAYCKAMGHNEYYEQVLKVITMLEYAEIRGETLAGEKWYEIDDIQDLNIAEAVFAEGKDKLEKFQNSYGGYWRYTGLKDFCYLVNPYYPPKKLLSEMKNSMETLIQNYPSGQNINSLLAAKYFGVRKENICVGNGAAELIKGLMEKMEGVYGIISPTFQEYPNRLSEDLIEIFHPNNSDFSYTEEDIIQCFGNKKIDSLILINPDNPSGNYIPVANLEKLIEWCDKRKITLILDESFSDFSDEGKTCIEETVLQKYQSLIIVKSISKAYGVPGIRIGVMASGNEKLIAQMKKEVAIWNINSFAEYYLQICEKYEKDFRNSLILIRKERIKLYQDLQSIYGLIPVKSQANYIMCRLERGNSTEVTEKLLNQYNIFIKDLAGKPGFEGKNYIRVAIRSEEENQSLVIALQRVMRGVEMTEDESVG